MRVGSSLSTQAANLRQDNLIVECRAMKWRSIIVGGIAAIAPIHWASAQDFPRHDTICVGGIVSKPKLASAFLNQDPKWQAIYQGSLQNDDANPTANPRHQP